MTVVHLTGPVRFDGDRVATQAWVVGDRFTLSRPLTTPDLRLAGWALPGLVDAHCHLGLGPDGPVGREETVDQARVDRDTGVLLVRDAGSPADTRWLDDLPDVPAVIRAGRHIARSRRYLRGVAVEVEPEHLLAEVRRQAAAGDGWVKLVGDWIDRDLGDLLPCWPDDALAPAIAAAHDVGARVTAHCFATEALPGLLAAGIDGIEHGTGFTEDLAARAAAQGVAVVPTLVQTATFPRLANQGAARFPRWSARMRSLHAARLSTVELLQAAGVPLYVGTDAGTVQPHGLVADEIRRLADVLGPVEALAAGSWGARAWLGRPALEEGAPADLVVYRGDPLADLSVLDDPVAVVRAGRVIAGSAERPGASGSTPGSVA